MPLSTDTKLRSGKRWQMPPVISWAIVLALPMKNDTPIAA